MKVVLFDRSRFKLFTLRFSNKSRFRPYPVRGRKVLSELCFNYLNMIIFSNTTSISFTNYFLHRNAVKTERNSLTMWTFFWMHRKFNPYILSGLWWYYKKMIALLLRNYIAYYFENRCWNPPHNSLSTGFSSLSIWLWTHSSNLYLFKVHKDFRFVFFHKIDLLTLWRRCVGKILD